MERFNFHRSDVSPPAAQRGHVNSLTVSLSLPLIRVRM